MIDAKNSSICLPLFPLPLVLLPGEPLPLHIFEERYKLMLKHAGEGDNSFGVILQSGRNHENVGCIAEIKLTEMLPDGRANILTVGSKRFKVVEVSEGQSYLTAKVELLNDPKPTQRADAAASKVHAAVVDIFRLSCKLKGLEQEVQLSLPESSTQLCYWVAYNFYRSVEQLQEVLESHSLALQLHEQYLMLDQHRRALAAEAAIEDAFS